MPTSPRCLFEHVSDNMLVPALIRMVLDSPGCATTDFSSLRRILYGASPVSASTLSLAYDEDQAKDSERRHTTEQVAYIVFE